MLIAGSQYCLDIKPPNRSRPCCHCIIAWNNKPPSCWELGEPDIFYSEPTLNCYFMCLKCLHNQILPVPLQIYVAGDRVVTDPLCKPFSIGRYLYSFLTCSITITVYHMTRKWLRKSQNFQLCMFTGILFACIQKSTCMMFLSSLRWRKKRTFEVWRRWPCF